MSETVHIPVNKRRLLIQAIFFSLIGVVVFVGAFAMAEQQVTYAYIWQSAGILAALFAILAAGAKLKKRAEKSAGLIINKQGFTDNSSDIGVGEVLWKSVKKIDREQCKKYDLLIVDVKKNEHFLNNAKNSAVKRLLQQNIHRYDTPVVIDPVYLSSDLDTVLGEIEGYYKVS